MTKLSLIPCLLFVGCGAGPSSVRGDAGALDLGPEVGGDVGAAPSCSTQMGPAPFALAMPAPEPNGVYDPDIVRDPTTGRLWMSYSGVDGPAGEGRISLHLAYSDDDGLTWCHEAQVVPAEGVPRDTQPAAIAQDNAHWRHEVSTLAYDPLAPADQRWWLAWNRYLHVDDGNRRTDDRRFEYGWVAVRRASSPEGLASAEERKLFSARGYHLSPSVEAFNDGAPGGVPEHRWDQDPILGSCLVLIESSLWVGNEGDMYWAAHCVRLDGGRDIVLATHDRSTGGWRGERVLLTEHDASAVHPAARPSHSANRSRRSQRARRPTSFKPVRVHTSKIRSSGLSRGILS